MTKLTRIVLTALLLAGALSACGSDEKAAPGLAAPPTRTAAPPTATPEPDDVFARLEIVSLRDPLLAFFDHAPEVGPLEYSMVFDQYVSGPHPECTTSAFYSGFRLVSLMDDYGLDLVAADLEGWRAVVEAFDEDAYVAALRRALEPAVEALPLDQTLRICVLIVPPFVDRRQDLTFNVFRTQVFDRQAFLAACSDADYCVETMAAEVVYAYAYSYQLARADYDVAAMPLMDMAIFQARADDLATALHPDAQFDWHVPLDPAEIPDLWGQMQQYAATTYSDYPDYRKIERLLYGQGSGGYPAWGGITIARQIVAAFHANNPDVAYAALANMAAADVIQDSGYSPE